MFIFSCLNLGDLNSDRYASKMVSKSKKNQFCSQISHVIYESLNFATKEAAAMPSLCGFSIHARDIVSESDSLRQYFVMQIAMITY